MWKNSCGNAACGPTTHFFRRVLKADYTTLPPVMTVAKNAAYSPAVRVGRITSAHWPLRTLQPVFATQPEDLLTDCWRDMRKEAAYGVDEVSAQEYEQHLGENIRQLVERLKRKSCRAKLVRWDYIPQENGKLRPLGMPAVEDKLLQLAVTRLLTAIYEQEFLRCMMGIGHTWELWTRWTN
jgi:hypothetical protein